MIKDELDYMYSLQRFGVKPGLAVMGKVMDVLGHPERQFKSVHIAGTNGKGSTAAMMASVLHKAGYRTGLYTSPHLVKFNERISIGGWANGRNISDANLARLVKQLRLVLEKESIQATFFEFTTAIAFMYFAERQVDIAVIEVGMGGRLDATNFITPLVAVITNIGRDHVQELGPTLSDIAGEKAGIMKPGVPVVIGETQPEIVKVLQAAADRVDCPWHLVSEELPVHKERDTAGDQVFSTTGVWPGRWAIPLQGRHQLRNAAAALAALYYLQAAGLSLTTKQVVSGLQEVIWQGRLQRIGPAVIDGAHNVDGMKALKEWLVDYPMMKVLVLALKKDKDSQAIIQEIVPAFPTVIVTEGSYEPMPARELAALVSPYTQNVEVVLDPAEATKRAEALLQGSEMMLVTGSLYMIGAAIQILRKKYMAYPYGSPADW
jgi:dihydrofolate synthase/folylpolyglutamate synthase